MGLCLSHLNEVAGRADEGCAIDWNDTTDVDVDIDGYCIVVLAASSVGLSFESNSSDCIRILKSTF